MRADFPPGAAHHALAATLHRIGGAQWPVSYTVPRQAGGTQDGAMKGLAYVCREVVGSKLSK